MKEVIELLEIAATMQLEIVLYYNHSTCCHEVCRFQSLESDSHIRTCKIHE